MLQRLFWALVEGGTATALLAAGGTDSLKALQVSLMEVSESLYDPTSVGCSFITSIMYQEKSKNDERSYKILMFNRRSRKKMK